MPASVPQLPPDVIDPIVGRWAHESHYGFVHVMKQLRERASLLSFLGAMHARLTRRLHTLVLLPGASANRRHVNPDPGRRWRWALNRLLEERRWALDDERMRRGV